MPNVKVKEQPMTGRVTEPVATLRTVRNCSHIVNCLLILVTSFNDFSSYSQCGLSKDYKNFLLLSLPDNNSSVSDMPWCANYINSEMNFTFV
jgi:hypothetical protein